MPGRHYSGPVENIGVWKCPACGAPNEGKLDAGCTSCHAGEPGRRAEERTPDPIPLDPMRVTFDRYFAEKYPELDEEMIALAWEAFRMGVQYARQTATTTDAPPVSAILPGTVETRTIIAALGFFAEQILSMQPEEVKTGEWLGKDDTLALIKRLEASHG